MGVRGKGEEQLERESDQVIGWVGGRLGVGRDVQQGEPVGGRFFCLCRPCPLSRVVPQLLLLRQAVARPKKQPADAQSDA